MFSFEHLERIADGSWKTQGFYGTAMYDFNSVYWAVRYSQLLPIEEGKELSAGLGIEVMEKDEIRLVYTSDLERGGSLMMVQLAGGTTFQPTGFRR